MAGSAVACAGMTKAPRVFVGVQIVAALTVGMLAAAGCNAVQQSPEEPAPGTPVRTSTPTPETAQRIACSGPSTPQIWPNDGIVDTPRGVRDHPQIRQATDITWREATGRFQVTLANGTCASWPRIHLHFFLGGSYADPAEVRLDYASADGWVRLDMNWDDVDEPGEDLTSAQLPVDVGPGEQKTYEFRLTLPEAPAKPSAFTGIEARLSGSATAAGTYRWGSSFSIESWTPHQVTVDAPTSITPQGPPSEFAVTVTNHGAREDRVRLELIMLQIPLTRDIEGVVGGATVDMYRGGTWHRLDAEARFSGDPSVTEPVTPEFTLPAGATRHFRFRVRSGPLGGPSVWFGAHLMRSGSSSQEQPMARGRSGPTSVNVPHLAVAAPTTWPGEGDTAEFAFTITNGSPIDYPLLSLRVYLTGRRFVASHTYRIDDARTWTTLDVPQTQQITPIDLPGLGGFEARAGTEQTQRLRLELARDPTEPLTYGVELLDSEHGTRLRLVTGMVP
jgi:hypothetical protein